MCSFIFLVFSFLIYGQTAISARVDQRQTGDLNVQIDLKNLQIVGLMKGKEEYVDYDYAYDYSDMTIKPPHGTNTTKKPLNVTDIVMSDKDNTTVATTVLAELDYTTSFVQNSSSTEILVTTTVGIEADNSSMIINNSTPPSAPDQFVNTNSTSSICKKGFYRNSKGSCELKLQNPSNALLNMIKQKTKLNGGNGVRRP